MSATTKKIGISSIVSGVFLIILAIPTYLVGGWTPDIYYDLLTLAFLILGFILIIAGVRIQRKPSNNSLWIITSVLAPISLLCIITGIFNFSIIFLILGLVFGWITLTTIKSLRKSND